MNDRLTAPRMNGIRTGWWSKATKRQLADALIQRGVQLISCLGRIEDREARG